jgi:hypothetical protein
VFLDVLLRSEESPGIATIYMDSEYHLEHRSKQGYKALLFDNPPGIRVFDADCQAAGISKNDTRGRVVDIHALRTTFGTHLAVEGVINWQFPVTACNLIFAGECWVLPVLAIVCLAEVGQVFDE